MSHFVIFLPLFNKFVVGGICLLIYHTHVCSICLLIYHTHVCGICLLMCHTHVCSICLLICHTHVCGICLLVWHTHVCGICLLMCHTHVCGICLLVYHTHVTYWNIMYIYFVHLLNENDGNIFCLIDKSILLINLLLHFYSLFFGVFHARLWWIQLF